MRRASWNNLTYQFFGVYISILQQCISVLHCAQTITYWKRRRLGVLCNALVLWVYVCTYNTCVSTKVCTYSWFEWFQVVSIGQCFLLLKPRLFLLSIFFFVVSSLSTLSTFNKISSDLLVISISVYYCPYFW